MSLAIASILVSFSTVAAFLNAYTEEKVDNGEDSSNPTSSDKSLYLFGAVL
jgi:hypothetical protein